MTSPEPEYAEPLQAEAADWRQLLRYVQPAKLGLFVASLFLFVLAISFMKEGARSLAPLVRDTFHVSNPVNSMGFGWLFAYVIMSGSPVAAAALAFFDAGAIDTLATFTMITGSRFGASFIVLFIGFIYVLRGRHRATSLGMGLLSLTITFVTYTAGLVVGVALLASGVLDGVQMSSGAAIRSGVDLIFDPIVNFALALLPRWALFPIGLLVIMGSFNLFDRCLPQMALKESQVGRVSRLVYKPWVMFLLGAGITMISMSVSLSLSILVPLSHRGFVRRENVIPYVMGANITTFIDTLLASVLLNNPTAFTVVLAEMLSIAIVSLLILLLFYRPFEHTILRFVNWTTGSNRNFAFFALLIVGVPILLMLY